jgi:hypothetical protein
MKKHLALTVCLLSGCLLLAGCSDADWDHVMNYGSSNEDAEVTPVTTVPVTAPASVGESANAGFCRGVAAQDAGDNDFDVVTQKRVFARSYAQCLTIYTR